MAISKRGLYFQPSILKRLKGQKYLYGHFRSFLVCLQKNNFGHTTDKGMVKNYKILQKCENDVLITLYDFWGIITKVEANPQFFMHIIMTVRVLDQSMWALQPMPELIRNTLVVKTNYQQHSMLG